MFRGRTAVRFDKLVIVESPNKVASFQKYIQEVLKENGGSLAFGDKDLKNVDANQKIIVCATVGHFKRMDDVIYESSSDGTTKFRNKWEVDPEKKNIASKMKDVAKNLPKGSEIIIATDPDREGELIGVHAFHELPKGTGYSRMYVSAITKEGIATALRERQFNFLDHDLAAAAETRHAMDRIFGFLGSRFVSSWRKDFRSVGRVQTPSLILLYNRSKAIKEALANKKASYSVSMRLSVDNAAPQTATVQFTVASLPFKPKPLSIDEKGGKAKSAEEKKKVSKFETKEEAEQALGSIGISAGSTAKGLTLVPAAKGAFHVVRTAKQDPPEPLTLQTLILEAGKKLRMTSEDVSLGAQKLFSAGLITYPRTDSTRIGEDTVQNKIIPHILKHHGKELLRPLGAQTPKKEKKSKGEGKEKKEGNVEDAHEAIHPTNFELLPSQPEVATKVGDTKLIGLYEIIHNATVASFMIPSEKETLTVTLSIEGKANFNVGASRTTQPGWKKVFQSAIQDEKAKKKNAGQEDEEAEEEAEKSGENADDDAAQPKVDEKAEGELFEKLSKLTPSSLAKEPAFIRILEVKQKEHFTKPPKPYTEGTLIEELKSNGVGRPSTYPSIMKTLVSRGYAEKRGMRLEITPLGEQLVELANKAFPTIVDINFTGSFERELDAIAKRSSKDITMNSVLSKFQRSFYDMITSSVLKLPGQKSMEIMPFSEAVSESNSFSSVLKAFDRYASLYIPKGADSKIKSSEGSSPAASPAKESTGTAKEDPSSESTEV